MDQEHQAHLSEVFASIDSAVASTSAEVIDCFPIILLLRVEGIIRYGVLHAGAVWQCQSCFSAFLERFHKVNHLLMLALMVVVLHSGWHCRDP